MIRIVNNVHSIGKWCMSNSDSDYPLSSGKESWGCLASRGHICKGIEQAGGDGNASDLGSAACWERALFPRE